MQSAGIVIPGLNLTQQFTYDLVNRITSGQETGGPDDWFQTYTYDQWGNRAVAGNYIPNAYATPTALTQYVNNQWLGSGVSYDPGGTGNQTALPLRTFAYDAENRLIASTQPGMGAISYVYDGEGRRVQKTVGPNVTTYIYDANGQLAAEYSPQGPPSPGTAYLVSDTLGSTRLTLDALGNVKERMDYLPFGEEIAAPVGRTMPPYSSGMYPSNPDIEAQKFTGKERDAETGLDFFGARYMSSAQGRWTTPDVVNVTDDRLLAPSSTLNKYVYGGNNPLKYTDPDGRDITVLYEQGAPTGHVMMVAVNQQTGDSAFLSVGPATQHDPNAANPLNWFSGVPGTTAFNLPKTADELRQNFAALTIQTSPEVAQQAIDAIRNGAGSGSWTWKAAWNAVTAGRPLGSDEILAARLAGSPTNTTIASKPIRPAAWPRIARARRSQTADLGFVCAAVWMLGDIAQRVLPWSGSL